MTNSTIRSSMNRARKNLNQKKTVTANTYVTANK